jgi:shikimate dehydrogenase
MHNAAFAAFDMDAVFVALPVAPARLIESVRGLASCGLLGMSVTIPHKERVIDACDYLAESAQAIGAVNCLSFEHRGTVGHNTDGEGFVDALSTEQNCNLAGKRVTLLGGGGAARAIANAVIGAGVANVTVVARVPEKVSWTTAQAFKQPVLEALLPATDLLVDCTPTGLVAGGEAGLPATVSIEELPEHALVASLVYHREPELLCRARARGLAVMDGVGMLVHQGARAFRIWTGREAPIEVMRQALTQCADSSSRFAGAGEEGAAD